MFAPHTLRAFIMFKEMCADWYIMFSAIWVVGGSKEQNGNIMWYTNCTSPTTWWYSWYVPNNGALYLHLVDGFLTFSHLFGESLTSAFGIGFATVSVIASPHLLGLPGSTVLGEGNQNKKVTYGHLQQSHMADLKEISSLLLEFIPVGGATASASARFLAASPIFEGLAPSAASWSVRADTAVFSSSMWSEQPAEWAAKWPPSRWGRESCAEAHFCVPEPTNPLASKSWRIDSWCLNAMRGTYFVPMRKRITGWRLACLALVVWKN